MVVKEARPVVAMAATWSADMTAISALVTAARLTVDKSATCAVVRFLMSYSDEPEIDEMVATGIPLPDQRSFGLIG